MKFQFNTPLGPAELEFEVKDLASVLAAMKSQDVATVEDSPVVNPTPLSPRVYQTQAVKRVTAKAVRGKSILSTLRAIAPLNPPLGKWVEPEPESRANFPKWIKHFAAEEKALQDFVSHWISQRGMKEVNRARRMTELRMFQRWLTANGLGSILNAGPSHLAVYRNTTKYPHRVRYIVPTTMHYFEFRDKGTIAVTPRRYPSQMERQLINVVKKKGSPRGISVNSLEIADQFRREYPQENALFTRFVNTVYPPTYNKSARLSELRNLQRWLGQTDSGSILNITAMQMQEYKAYTRDQNHYFNSGTIKHFLDFCEQQGLISSNPL